MHFFVQNMLWSWQTIIQWFVTSNLRTISQYFLMAQKKIFCANVQATILKGNLGYDQWTWISQINTSNLRCLVRTVMILDGKPYKGVFRIQRGRPPTILFWVCTFSPFSDLSRQLYTKAVDSIVGALWLATETRDSKCYSPPSKIGHFRAISSHRFNAY